MNKNLLKIAGIISIVLGIICCLTIFGAIVGVPLIIGGNKIKDMANLSDQELLQQKEYMKGYLLSNMQAFSLYAFPLPPLNIHTQ